MPTHERRGTDNRENRQDRWKPAIQLDEEPTIVVREPDAATQVAPQDNQLMSERGILSLKPDLRLEQRGQHGQDKPDEPDHRGNLADSSLNKPEFGFRYTQDIISCRTTVSIPSTPTPHSALMTMSAITASSHACSGC